MDGTMEESPVAEPSFSVAHQSIDLDVDFRTRKIVGKTELTLHPQSKDLKTISLNLRQARITRLTVNGKSVSRMTYADPCTKSKLNGKQTAHQFHLLATKLAKSIKDFPDGEMVFDVPRSVRIEEINVNTMEHTQTAVLKAMNGSIAEAPLVDSAQALVDSSVAHFTPLAVNIEFTIDDLGDGLQFVSHSTGSGRFPHAYTPKSNVPGIASCIFPCVDAVHVRCTWDIKITCPRTIRDALRDSDESRQNGEVDQQSSVMESAHHDREMIVVCSGEDAGRREHKQDARKTTFSFSCMTSLSAQQIGFAIGPFEEVKLSDLRLSEDDVGQNAVEVLGYCLPGRADELRNTCLPTVRAIDFVTLKYVACPFKTYRMCFVDDLEADTAIAGAFTLCSTRLLYPLNIIDLSDEVTRKLVHAIVSQWVGIDIVPQQPMDIWAVVGIAYFVTEAFMKELCGNNDFRSRMKLQSDRVFEMDHNRPSLFDSGRILHVDPSELEFISLKAPLVLFILDRRIAKVAGLPKMPAIISKILLRARRGELPGNSLSTEVFQKTCERFYHHKIDDFLSQWVYGGGCPHFKVQQNFNKKKLVVEMKIQQVQGDVKSRDLTSETFLRDVREDFHNVWAAPVQNVFTGSITIRVHEADGTPYEHVVDIRDGFMKFDIPYNTKYKRLKRSKRQREKNVTVMATNVDQAEAENETLFYSLGDVLQNEEDVRNWSIKDWTAEDEETMSQQSYEWIRVDADFEWICRLDLIMPGYMHTSQLQQDRDVVAQMESIRAIIKFDPSQLISSILLRTVMDRRYFHRVRTAAAVALVREAASVAEYIGLVHLKKAFESLFCSSDANSTVVRPNDFSDPAEYQLQCGLIQAISRITDENGIAKPEVIEFLLDKLKFNNNDTNQFSDCFYVSLLMRSLCDAVSTHSKQDLPDDQIDMNVLDRFETDRRHERETLEIIDRYRKMDEWSGSYQNLYSRSALECQRKLLDSGITGATNSMGSIQFLQYTRPGNYEMLRQRAFESLTEPGMISNPAILRYVTVCMSADPSPWIRANLRRLFGRVLGSIAIGEHMKARQKNPADDLEIVNADSAEDQQIQMARKKNVETALIALKDEIGSNESLKQLLWAAANAKNLSLSEVREMLDFCRMLYEPQDSLVLKLQYPRYWKIKAVDGGKITFGRTDRVRSTPIVKWVQEAAIPAVPSKKYDLLPPSNSTTPKEPRPRIVFKNPAAPPQPPPVEPRPSPAVDPPPRPSLKIKLTMPKPAQR